LYTSLSSHPPLDLFFFSSSAAPHALHSFPTRRSSDLSPATRRASRDRWPPRSPGHPPSAPATRSRASATAFRPPRRSTTRCRGRSEEHTSELQSRGHLVCRLLLEKKKKTNNTKQYKHT